MTASKRVVPLLLLALTACATPGVGDSVATNPSADSESDSDSEVSSPTPSKEKTSAPSTTAPSKPATDPPATPAKTEQSLFPALPPFSGTKANDLANDHHLAGLRDMTGNACLNCHGGTPTSLYEEVMALRAPHFAFGGTIYRKDGTPAARAEVRVVDQEAAVATTIISDEDGNFWLKATSELKHAATAVRDSNGEQRMHATLTNGNCNSSECHGEKMRITLH